MHFHYFQYYINGLSKFRNPYREIRKNLNSHKRVIPKNTQPVTAIATRFLETKSQENGDRIL
jgi:hypothetical protein